MSDRKIRCEQLFYQRRRRCTPALTSVLQQARKAAGLEVSDRIKVAWHSDDAEVVAAIRQYRDAIAAEVLATEFTESPSALPTIADLNGKKISYTLTKA